MNDHDPRWQAFIERAHTVDILDVAQRMTKLRHEGRDWCGPCPRPGCAKKDGFVVTPSTGAFVCRPSTVGGDAIDMVMHGRSCSFVEAVEFITGESRPDRSRDETPEQKAERERKWAEAKAEADRRAAEQRKEDEKRKAQAERHVADVLQRAVPIWGTHAEAYLCDGRKLAIQERLCRDLLFVPELDYWGYDCTEDQFIEANPGRNPKDQRKVLLATVPAMVVRVRNAAGDDGFSIHQTFLDPVEPRKWRPPVDPDRNSAKKFRGSPKGGLLRLGRPGRCLAIGEGIESTFGWFGLGAGPDDVSIAAAGAIDLIQPGSLPEVVREVIILADNDGAEREKNLKKLQKAGRSIVATGRQVSFHVPPVGTDWADVAEAFARDAREAA